MSLALALSIDLLGTMLSSFEVIYSSLQTSFLAFAVYLSAIILKTLLQGKSLLWFHWNRTQSECHEVDECIDGGGIDCTDGGEDPDKIISIVLQVPRIFPTTSPTTSSISSVIDSLLEPIDEDIVDNMLFTSSKFISLNHSVQECVEVSSSYNFIFM